MSGLPQEWRRVPLSPYRAYEVSSDGRVRRNRRELVGDIDYQGYRRVVLSYAGLGRRFKVHRLVCEAFHGAAPAGAQAAHLDGNPLNNAAENLAWKTPKENNADKLAHGTHQAGERHPMAKLTLENVKAIRASNESSRALGRRYGVGSAQICRIKHGLCWSGNEAPLNA